jgi:hypothetical protein
MKRSLGFFVKAIVIGNPRNMTLNDVCFIVGYSPASVV